MKINLAHPVEILRLLKADTVLCQLRIRYWNPHDWATVLIALVATSRGKRHAPIEYRFVHAAKIVESEGRLMLAEVTAGGGRELLLAEVVKLWSGRLMLYRNVASGYDRQKAAAAMVEATGKPYGWIVSILAGLSHLFFLGGLARRLALQFGGVLLPNCSMEVTLADIAGGANPCPDLRPCQVEPHHLAESPLYAYVGTLVWEENR